LAQRTLHGDRDLLICAGCLLHVHIEQPGDGNPLADWWQSGGRLWQQSGSDWIRFGT